LRLPAAVIRKRLVTQESVTTALSVKRLASEYFAFLTALEHGTEEAWYVLAVAVTQCTPVPNGREPRRVCPSTRRAVATTRLRGPAGR
jgi:hypothetical protein